ncbi:hypothetical protein D3C78_1369250 [compost metagenome]
MGAKRYPRADTGTGLDHHPGTDGRTRVDQRILGNQRARVDARHGNRLAVEQVRQLGKSQIGVGQHQGCAGVAFGIGRGQQHRTGLATGEMLAVMGIGEEGQLLRTGVLQGGKPADRQIGRALQLGPHAQGQLTQGKDGSAHGISAAGSCARSPAW